MDHVVYVDHKAQELEKLLEGAKTCIIRGAAGRKLPYGRVNPGDILYFIRNNGEGLVRARGQVSDVFNSEKMDKDESIQLVEDNHAKLQLSPQQLKKWAGKRYLVLIDVDEVQVVEAFPIDKSGYSNMDDWLPVEDIDSVKT
ncbi:MAG: hypothetical protein DWQ07_19380 [Chloroflexi bacterium]|nr:MAG: hypothetical protein DWQ07_19380 [Chloroflexota bacterium]MBL1194244.1 hypothetical protein [Chloroflexota bacterium]NOH11537.1 hypothetical protein [Chloroflexota bacterium]